MKKEGAGISDRIISAATVGVLAAAGFVGVREVDRIAAERQATAAKQTAKTKLIKEDVEADVPSYYEKNAETERYHDKMANDLLSRFAFSDEADKQKIASDGLKAFLEWHGSEFERNIVMRIARTLSAKELKEYSDKNPVFKQFVVDEISMLEDVGMLEDPVQEINKNKEIDETTRQELVEDVKQQLFRRKRAVELLKKCL